jgi:hypothetical protein
MFFYHQQPGFHITNLPRQFWIDRRTRDFSWFSIKLPHPHHRLLLVLLSIDFGNDGRPVA